jgi:nucleoside-diphosphate-sugar epimerase
LGDAAGYAERERLIADWAADRPDLRVSVLRPAVVIGAGIDSAPARALSGRVALRPHQLDPPRQFVHVEDLAAAIAVAAGDRLDGVFNVAPDGWIGGEQARVLGSGGPTLALPNRIVTAVAAVAWKLRLSTIAPEVIPLLEQPWVVANDRLRGVGWSPSFTNEEALVAGTAGNRWREMSPARRQQVALAGSGAVITAVAAGLTAVLRRRRLRRS